MQWIIITIFSITVDKMTVTAEKNKRSTQLSHCTKRTDRSPNLTPAQYVPQPLHLSHRTFPCIPPADWQFLSQQRWLSSPTTPFALVTCYGIAVLGQLGH